MKYGELKRTDIEKLDKTNKVVIVPLASLEQHGQHLPLLTDSLIGGEIAARVETGPARHRRSCCRCSGWARATIT